MSSYDSMKSKLAPLGVYTLAAGSEIDCELQAYGCGLDVLFDKLDEFEREAFIATAESYGLSEWERFLEKEREEQPTASRRALLLGYEQGLRLGARASDFAHFLASCGLEQAVVREYPADQRLEIEIGDVLDEGRKSLVGKKITQALPAHLNATITFRDNTSISV